MGLFIYVFVYFRTKVLFYPILFYASKLNTHCERDWQKNSHQSEGKDIPVTCRAGTEWL
jgi:hypothetical protein